MSEAVRIPMIEPMEPALDRPPSYVDRMPQIAGALRENAALGLIVVDASALAAIERSYGVEAYRRASEVLHRLVLEAGREYIGPTDFVVAGELETDQVFVFFARPRSDDAFYREALAAMLESLRVRFRQSGQRIVYPYRHDPPRLAVGQAICFHNPGLREDRQVRHLIDSAVRDAQLNESIAARERARRFTDLVLAEGVTILYEPIVNVTTRDVLGYEALVRGPWDSDLHSPGALFALAEETELVFELDCLCRRAALRGARGLPPGKLLFLNCLPTAIHDPAFRGDVLRKTLEDLRLRPSDLVFEISERESIDNFAIFGEARDYYGELGLRIALDDTGVAYGSLESLMELRPDFVKVDISLVRSIDTDPPRQELLRALNSVAAKIDALIIAEGIETSEELATVQSLGVALGQGYLFGRPAPLRRMR